MCKSSLDLLGATKSSSAALLTLLLYSVIIVSRHLKTLNTQAGRFIAFMLLYLYTHLKTLNTQAGRFIAFMLICILHVRSADNTRVFDIVCGRRFWIVPELLLEEGKFLEDVVSVTNVECGGRTRTFLQVAACFYILTIL